MLSALTFPQLTPQVLNRLSLEPWEPFKVALIKFLTVPSLYWSPHFYPKISVFFLVSTHFPYSQIREKSILKPEFNFRAFVVEIKFAKCLKSFQVLSFQRNWQNLVSRLHLGGNSKGRWALVRMVAYVSFCINSSGEKSWKFSVTFTVVATSRHELKDLSHSHE